jgi:hypothetical protein
MNDSKKRKGSHALLMACVTGIVLLPIAYVLSVGPAYWLGDHGLMSHAVFNALYEPLSYAYHHYPWTNPFLDWWESVWR